MPRKIKINRDGSVHIEHFDTGGTIAGSTGITSSPYAATLGSNQIGGASTGGVNQNAVNPNTGIGGTINSALGTTDTFQANGANILNGTNAGQINQGYTGAQAGLGQAAGLAQALQPGATQAAGSQQDLLNALTAQAAGKGPNPAQAQLNQNTATNIQNQAALAAGQRGASGNVGLMSRQIGQQGAATQQNAVGQAATLQAQQQLAAQQQEQAQQQAMLGEAGQANTALNQGEQNEQQILQGANSAYNNNAVGMQSNINNVNSQTAATNANAAGNTVQNIVKSIPVIGSLFAKGGTVPSHLHSMAKIYHPHMYAGGGDVMPTASTDQPAENPNQAKRLDTKMDSDIPKDSPLRIQTFAGGGLSAGEPSGQSYNYTGSYNSAPQISGPNIQPTAALPQPQAPSNALSDIGSQIAKLLGPNAAKASAPNQNLTEDQVAAQMGAPGTRDANGMPTEDAMYQLMSTPQAEAKGGKIDWKPMKEGGNVAGKSKVDHDSYSNDNVKAMLSPGELVVDLDTMNDPGPMGQMARTLAEHLQKKNGSKNSEHKDFKDALAAAIKSRKTK